MSAPVGVEPGTSAIQAYALLTELTCHLLVILRLYAHYVVMLY